MHLIVLVLLFLQTMAAMHLVFVVEVEKRLQCTVVRLFYADVVLWACSNAIN